MPFPRLQLQLPAEFLADFLAAASQAKRRIWLQTMNYDPSPETAAIEKVLVEKAQKKLDIRMNIDWVSERFYDHAFNYVPNRHVPNFTNRKKYDQLRQASLNRVREAGGQVTITNTPPYLKSFFPIAGRNHIKMYIVDDTVWMGGVNLVTDGFNNIDGMIKTTNQAFLVAMTDQFSKVNQQRAADHYAVQLAENLELLIDNGQVGNSLIYNTAIQAIQNAKSEIQLYSQIMPTGKLMTNLLAKSRAKVPVTFITSDRDDDVFNHFPEALFYQQFRAKIHHNAFFKLIHLDQKLHLKLLLIDNQEFFFGSHNLSQVGVQLGTEEIMLHGTNENLVKEFKVRYQAKKTDETK